VVTASEAKQAPIQVKAQEEWTLTVKELVGSNLTRPGEDIRLAGPWVFRFRVP